MMERRRLATRLYGLALGLYPASFRARYSDELMATFEAGLADAHGVGGRAMFVAVSLAGALRNGVAERVPRVRRRSGLTLDLRAGMVAMRRRPGFAFAAALPVALGVAGVTAVFAVMDGVLLRPLPYPEPDRLVEIGSPRTDGSLTSISSANLLDIEDALPSLQVAGVTGGVAVVDGDTNPVLIRVSRPTRRFMEVFGVTPAIGRRFREDEFAGPEVAMLTWSYWRRAWDGDPSAVGAILNTRTGAFRIIGVLPRSWHPPEALDGADGEVWIPLDYADPALRAMRAYGFTSGVGRLGPGVTLEAANDQLRAAAMELSREYPEDNTDRDGNPRLLEARSLHSQTVGDIGSRIGLLFGAVAFLLAIACANVANLFLARTTERERELAIRAVHGAGRRRLATQLLAEAVLVGVAGGAAGLGLVRLALDTLVSLMPDLPRAQAVTVDLRVAGAAFGVSLLCGMAFGVVPALTASQRDPWGALRGASQRSRGAERLRGALIVGQTALALALIIGGALLVNSAARLAAVDLGYHTEGIISVRPRLTSYSPVGEEMPSTPFYLAFQEALAALPGVEGVSGTMFLPGQGVPAPMPPLTSPATGEAVVGWRHTVLPGFFDILDIPIIEGRSLGPQDVPGAVRAVVVSRSLAQQMWPDRPAVGRSFTSADSEDAYTVVGVAQDIRNRGPHEAAEAVLYESFLQHPWLPSLAMLVRHRGAPSALMPSLRQALRAVDPGVPLGEVLPLSQVVASHTVEERHYALLLGGFSLTALAIAAVGVYATVSYTVSRRLRELAIRMAVGAGGRDVIGLVLRRGMAQAATGAVLGLGLAVATADALESLLFRITSSDPLTYLITAVALLVVALVACLVPALRAVRVDPIAIMRSG